MIEDTLRDLVLEKLHSGPDGYRSLVRDIAVAHPDRPAQLLEAALIDAARTMDATIRTAGSPTDEARTARRLALLLAMDLEGFEAEEAVTLGTLLSYWRREDDFFLRL